MKAIETDHKGMTITIKSGKIPAFVLSKIIYGEYYGVE